MTETQTEQSRTRLRAALGEVDALMSGAVYEALFDDVAAHQPRQIVEIGTAHGAGTIAMALGAGSVGASTRITTVDTLEALPDIPSSRSAFGDARTNERIVRGNFDRAGVGDRITMFVGRSDAFAAQIDGSLRIDMLVLDADGRIDRDFLLLRDHLTEGCRIVVDDIDGKVGAVLNRRGVSLDLKHVISRKITEALVERGYLRFERRVEDTSFFTAPDPCAWNPEEIADIALRCYRELIFLRTPVSTMLVDSVASALRSSRLLRPLYGSARAVYRALFKRR